MPILITSSASVSTTDSSSTCTSITSSRTHSRRSSKDERSFDGIIIPRLDLEILSKRISNLETSSVDVASPPMTPDVSPHEIVALLRMFYSGHFLNKPKWMLYDACLALDRMISNMNRGNEPQRAKAELERVLETSLSQIHYVLDDQDRALNRCLFDGQLATDQFYKKLLNLTTQK